MENQPRQSYTSLAISIVLASAILSAAILGTSISHTTVTSISTETSVSTTNLTTVSTQATTVTQTVTTTIIPVTISVDSINQNGQTISGYGVFLYAQNGTTVAHGSTPSVFPNTVGQTYSIAAENVGLCNFVMWSDGVTSNPRTYTAEATGATFTAVYDCEPAETASGYTVTTLPSDVKAGDMLVVAVVETNNVTVLVGDSLETALQLAVGSYASAGSPTSYGQSYIYWGMLTSSGPDTVTVTEPVSDAALRVEVWEFSGVDAIGATASCTPLCPSTSYPASSVLLATGVTVIGSGPDFTWYPFAASEVAGSEYQITSSAGSTTFPFYPPATLDEAGVVLLKSSGSADVTLVQEAQSTCSYVCSPGGGITITTTFVSTQSSSTSPGIGTILRQPSVGRNSFVLSVFQREAQ